MKLDDLNRVILNSQRELWEGKFSSISDMFGEEPSRPAQDAAKLLKQAGKNRILELGGGQGRDTIFLGQLGFQVSVLDYCKAGISVITEKALALRLSQNITALQHDVRKPLPFEGETFDCCYSHMLFCMALSTSELQFLSSEVLRVLKPGGFCIYTVRNTDDAHYGNGVPRGEDMYEVGGFIVHFFTEEKVKQLAKGYELMSIERFEEGGLPRKLFKVILRKPSADII